MEPEIRTVVDEEEEVDEVTYLPISGTYILKYIVYTSLPIYNVLKQ